MSGVNKVILVGRLGGDPEMKTLNGGQTVGNFSIATSEAWTGKDGTKQERTEWHRITAWGKLADICGKHLKKGRQVYIEGKIQTDEYEKDGVKKYATKIIANTVQFLGDAPGRAGAAPGGVDGEPSFDSSEEIPF